MPAFFSHASRSSTKIGVPGSRYGTPFRRGMSIRMPRVTYAVPEALDAQLRAALLGVDVGAGVAVVGLVLVEDVAQRVDVAVRVAVIRHPIGVGGEAAVHRVLERAGVVGIALGDRRMRETHRLAHATSDAACFRLAGRDEVERAELVVRAPASPVLHLLEVGVEVGVRDRIAGRRRAGREDRPRAAARPAVGPEAPRGDPGACAEGSTVVAARAQTARAAARGVRMRPSLPGTRPLRNP